MISKLRRHRCKSLHAYGIKSRQAEYRKAVARATAWLEKAEPKANEDYAFRVLGSSGATPVVTRSNRQRGCFSSSKDRMEVGHKLRLHY